MLPLALETRQDEMLMRLLDCRQQAGLVTGIHLDSIGREASEIQRAER